MQFSKMHVIGNDFMVIDAITQNVSLFPKLIRRLSNRHIGIGFDQLLIIEPPCYPDFDFNYRIFNADGSETMQCGNGACCVAYFVRLKSLTKKSNIQISTAENRRMILNIINNNLIQVNMGEPIFEPSLIPFKTQKKEKKYVINISNKLVSCGVVSIGNPHCVIQVNNTKTISIETLGPILEHHKCFPQRVNVNFMQVIQQNHIRLRVYERGVGETKSCGSGACASVAVGIIQGTLTEEVCVELPGGKMNIFWKGPGHMMYMTGSATHIYDGNVNL